VGFGRNYSRTRASAAPEPQPRRRISNADASNLKTAQMKNDELKVMQVREEPNSANNADGCKVWPPKVATSTLVSLVSKLRASLITARQIEASRRATRYIRRGGKI